MIEALQNETPANDLGSPPVDAFRSIISEADRLASIANDMEAEADMTHNIEAARILRGAAHKVRKVMRGLKVSR